MKRNWWKIRESPLRDRLPSRPQVLSPLPSLRRADERKRRVESERESERDHHAANQKRRKRSTWLNVVGKFRFGNVIKPSDLSPFTNFCANFYWDGRNVCHFYSHTLLKLEVLLPMKKMLTLDYWAYIYIIFEKCRLTYDGYDCSFELPLRKNGCRVQIEALMNWRLKRAWEYRSDGGDLILYPSRWSKL